MNAIPTPLIPIAPDYTLAQDLITYLQSHLPPDMVYPEVWDKGEQVAAITLSAGLYTTQVCVSVGNPTAITPNPAEPRIPAMMVPLLISVIAASELADYPEPHKSLSSYLSGLASVIAALVQRWDVELSGYNYTEPHFIARQDLDFADFVGLDNYVGKAVLVNCFAPL